VRQIITLNEYQAMFKYPYNTNITINIQVKVRQIITLNEYQAMFKYQYKLDWLWKLEYSNVTYLIEVVTFINQ